MNRTARFIAIASVGLLSSCSQAPTPASSPPATPPTAANPAASPPQATAKAAAKDFADTLRARLQAKIAADGPVEAIGFCKSEAPRIAEQVQAKHGVRLGRVAVPGRLRNPSNAGAPWTPDVLQAFARRAEAGEPVAQLSYMAASGMPAGVAVRFAKAIDVQPACLACHGKAIDPPIAAAIRQTYPADSATGLEAGDLRGLLWVEVPSPP